MRKNDTRKMYEVHAKGGHTKGGLGSRDGYIELILPIMAYSKKEAAEIARRTPRVKHHHKDAIRSVDEINERRFVEIEEHNRNNPYFSCHNIQDQRRYCPDIEIIMESRAEEHYRRKSGNGMNRKKYWTHYVDHYDPDMA